MRYLNAHGYVIYVYICESVYLQGIRVCYVMTITIIHLSSFSSATVACVVFPCLAFRTLSLLLLLLS